MSRRNPGSSSTSSHSRRGGSSAPSTSGGGSFLSDLFKNPVVKVGENLLTDVKDTVIGIPTGLVMTVKDPLAVGKALATSEWDMWSPLFKGDFEKFGKGLYDHPLAPILDVLSVLTLGAGLAAKGAKGLSAAGMEGRAITALAAPKLTRPLFSGHVDDLAAVVEHTKGYNKNPFIRARQVTSEKAINSMAGLLPSWFKVDRAIPEHVAQGFNGAERADAWRWLRADKYDEASRRHTTAAASTLAISGIMAASKRLRESPATAARQFMPNIIDNLKTHAHVVPESKLPQALRREMTDAEIAKMDRKARAAFRKQQQNAEAAAAGTDIVKYDPATAAAGKTDVVDSYGFPIDDVEVANATTINKRYVFVHKNAEAATDEFLRKHPNLTPQQLADYLASRGEFSEGKGLAGKLVTSDWRQAARDAHGNFLVARNHAHYLEEAGNSVTFLGKLTKSATTAWKWAILGLRPAYLVNNAVGNMFMYFVSQGPQGIRGLVDATRQIYRPHEIMKGMSRAERQFFRSSIDWQDKYYLGLHRGFSKDASDQLAGESVRIPFAELGGKKAKLVRVAGTGLYDITHVVSDRTLRRASINTIMRGRPEVQAFMKQGMHFDDAAAAASESRALREAVQQQVNDILGQYHYLNPAERAIRAIVPFYTWDRAIVRHGAHLYLDRPTTALAMTSLGQQGVETTEQMLGDIPDFLRGALPLSMVGLPESVDGRVPILGTAGFNPYSSLDSVIRAGQALTTGGVPAGEVLAGQINPFATALIEQTTGQSLLSGARLPASATEGGILPNVIASVFGNLPQTKLANAAINGPQGNDKSLYPNDALQFLYAYLGVPAKALNVDAAAAMAARRDGVPSSKSKSRRG